MPATLIAKGIHVSIDPKDDLAAVVHLGPVAQEIDQKDTGSLTPEFLGVTPQGWMRDWPRQTGGKVTHIPLRLPGELRRPHRTGDLRRNRPAIRRIARPG